MENQTTISTKEDIIRESKKVFEETTQFIRSVSPEQTHVKVDGKWSVLEEFSHMILSIKLLVTGLGLPKITFIAFGKPNRPSRSFEEVVKRYHEKLEEGGVAPKQFLPKEVLESKEDLLKNWEGLSQQYLKAIDSHWKEENLDKHLAPHPLLGKLTIREMLFFTILHSNHHLNNIKQKAG